MSEPQPLRHQFEREIEELGAAPAGPGPGGRVGGGPGDQGAAEPERGVGRARPGGGRLGQSGYLRDRGLREQDRGPRTAVATDLRFIITSLHVVIALERIGDLAVHVAKVAQKLASEKYIKPLISMNLMADRATQMVRDSVHAFVNRDELAAQDVAAGDGPDRQYLLADVPRAAHLHDGVTEDDRAGADPAVRGEAVRADRRPRHQYLRSRGLRDRTGQRVEL